MPIAWLTQKSRIGCKFRRRISLFDQTSFLGSHENWELGNPFQIWLCIFEQTCHISVAVSVELFASILLDENFHVSAWQSFPAQVDSQLT